MKRKLTFALLAALAAGGTFCPPARADRMKWARELAEAAIRRLGKGAAAEGGEALARRLATTAARHGDDLVASAFRKVGPRAITIAEEAGEQAAPRALAMLARHGDEAAAVLTRSSLKLLPLGEEAAEALIRHKGIGVPMLEAFGEPAARALAIVSPRNGRRLAMLRDNLLRVRRAKEVMEVVAKYGDPAMEFIWKNKGALAVTATLTTFLAAPEPFLKGARSLTETVADKVVVPVATKAIGGGVEVADTLARNVVGAVAQEAARAVPWGWIAALTSLAGGGIVAVVAWRLSRG